MATVESLSASSELRIVVVGSVSGDISCAVVLASEETEVGSFAPNSKTAEAMSAILGKQTVLSGSLTRSAGRDGNNRQLQMIERPLMTVDELKSMPKGHFVVMKTGCHPMQTVLKLFFKWGIVFEKEPYSIPEKSERKVCYSDVAEVEKAIVVKYGITVQEPPPPQQMKVPMSGKVKTKKQSFVVVDDDIE